MAYRKINIYGGERVSVKVLSYSIVVGILLLTAIMIIGTAHGGYTVKFQNGNGTMIANTKLKYGSQVEKPDDPKIENYVFTGWFTDEEKTVPYDFENGKVNGNMTLYAGFEPAVMANTDTKKGTGNE